MSFLPGIRMFSENHQKLWGNCRILKRAMTEKNGESTPRVLLVFVQININTGPNSQTNYDEQLARIPVCVDCFCRAVAPNSHKTTLACLKFRYPSFPLAALHSNPHRIARTKRHPPCVCVCVFGEGTLSGLFWRTKGKATHFGACIRGPAPLAFDASPPPPAAPPSKAWPLLRLRKLGKGPLAIHCPRSLSLSVSFWQYLFCFWPSHSGVE